MPDTSQAPSLAQTGVAGLVLLVGSLALSPLVVLLVRTIFPGRNVLFARWGFSHVLLVVLAAVVVLGISVRLFPPELSGAGLIAEFVRMALGLGAGALVIVAVAQRVSPEGWRALGLAPGGNLRALAAGWSAYLLLFPGLFGLLLAWNAGLQLTLGEVEPQPVLRYMLELPREDRVLAVALGVFLLPLLEELAFRVFLQPLLVQNLRERGGIAVTSLLFAALHGSLAAFLPVFALSLLLGAVMLRTQRLLAVWGVHALHNGIIFTLVFAQPELVDVLDKPGLLFLF